MKFSVYKAAEDCPGLHAMIDSNSILKNLMFVLCCVASSSSMLPFCYPLLLAGSCQQQRAENGAYCDGTCKERCCGMNPPAPAAPQVARTLPSAFDFHHSTSGAFQDTNFAARTINPPYRMPFQERGFLPPLLCENHQLQKKV
ncbi:hypothetical protein OIU79_028334, partial [Salix purpurea]